MPRLTVGLTGGIASGKTLVGDSFAALGVPVLDADLVAREVVAKGTPALAAIAADFGPQFLLADGSLDRRLMRAHVFADPAARRRLEAITHPAIRTRLLEWRAAQPDPYCILSVAILVEANMRSLVDRVLVVDVPVEVQLQRLVDRDGIDSVLAQSMIDAQASRAERCAAADDVLVNTGPIAQTRAAVLALHRHYLDLASSDRPGTPGLVC